MNWRVELSLEALADIDEAASWYEEKSRRLGRDFVREVSTAISSLLLGPLTPRLRHRTAGIRWAFSKRFPYRIIYRVEADRVVVFAVLHVARSDIHWRGRVKP